MHRYVNDAPSKVASALGSAERKDVLRYERKDGRTVAEDPSGSTTEFLISSQQSCFAVPAAGSDVEDGHSPN
jgi:hypothetical protein